MSLATSARSTAHTHAAAPLTLRGVSRTFPGRDGAASRTVLADVDLDVTPGEIVALVGASGCGKSTLLRQVAGLDTPTTGEIRIGDTPVARFDRRTAVAFQEPRLLPWRTLTQNVAVGLPRGTDRATGAARVAELLELVSLGDCARYRPRQVSGGMAQRASLARALARNPAVLLLDEPFGALDALTRLRMQDLLLEIHAAEPTTILLGTPDVDEALYLADRVVLLGRPAGTAPGTPATVREIVPVPSSRPRDRAAEDTARRLRLLDGRGVATHHGAPDLHHSI